MTPGSLVPDEDQGFYIAAVILPDGATLERTDKVVKQVEEAIRANPANQDIVSFTGFDFIGGGFRNNAATIFVTQMPWDKREVTAAQLVGELFGKTMGIKEALVLAFNPPAIFGLGTAGGYEFYIQNRGEGGAKRLDRGHAGVPRAREQRHGARRRADAVARDRAAALRRRRPREGEEARRADRRRVQRARRHARHLLRQRLQQVRPDVAGADVGRPGVPQAARRHRRRLRALRQGRDDSARPRSRRCSYTSGPDALDRFNNLPAVKIIGQAAPGFSSGQAIARGRADRDGSAADGLQLRLGRHVVPGEALGRRVDASRSCSR